MKNFVTFLEKYENSSKCAMYLIAPNILSKAKSLAESHSPRCLTKFDLISLFTLKDHNI